MDQDSWVGKWIALSFGSCGQQYRTHAGGLSDTHCGNIRFYLLHGIVNRHTGRDDTAGGIYVKIYVFIRIFRFEEQQLCDQKIGDFVIDGSSQKNYSVFQEPWINVVGSLPPATLFYDHRY